MATHTKQQDFLATSRAPKSSLLLGSHQWTIHNDAAECSETQSYNTSLTLSACSLEEFTCSGGSCIGMEQRCDRRTDCMDGSDEQDCGMVVQKPGYHKFLTPSPEEGSLRINVSVNILDILDINEVKDLFVVKIDLVREWFDHRLIYLNLKKDTLDLNNLLPNEIEDLWYPSVDTYNIEHEKKRRATSVPHTYKVHPNKNFQYEKADMTHEKNAHLFKGSENRQFLRKQWSVKFICHYNTMMYPFDSQLCSMQFLEGAGYSNMDLRPSVLSYNPKISLNQYFVRAIQMCTSKVVGKQAIVVEVSLGRPLMSNILTVFIPTTILLAISYMARVFQEEFLDMVVQVNLTVLLVQATL